MRGGVRFDTAQGRRLSPRALLVFAGIVVLLIAGLLGMHVLGGAAGGHAGHGASSVALETGSISPAEHTTHLATAQHGHETASLTKAAACPSTCGDDSPLAPGHAELMACVLALLVGLLVLVPPTPTRGSWASIVLALARIDASAVLLVPPTPSLTLLSISRT